MDNFLRYKTEEANNAIPRNCVNYFITSSGRIWGTKSEDCLEGEAQERRNVLGNNFKTPEEAAMAKAQLEAWNRVRNYIRKKIIIRDGQPVLEFICDFPADNYLKLSEDLSLLGQN